MTDTTQGASAPKKRPLFKRAAWQDAAKTEGEDMFSHANEFKDLVVEQARCKDEEEQKAERERRRRQIEQRERKRRKVSPLNEEPIVPKSGSGSRPRKRTGSKAYANTL